MRAGVGDVVATLKEFKAKFPGVLTGSTVEMVVAFLSCKTFSTKPYVYGLKTIAAGESSYDVTVKASLKEPLTCSVTVTQRLSG